MDDDLLTPEELAAICRVAVRTVYGWNHKGTGPRRTHLGGRTLRYRRGDVHVWLATNYADDGGTR